MKAKITWIGIIVGLLSMSLITHGVLLVLAVGDPSFALVPDYEQRAANWDAVQAERWASERLGWTADLSTMPGDFPGTVDIALKLSDRDDATITDATVVISGFHLARASHPLATSLEAGEDGAFTANIPIWRSGVWEFEIVATRDTDRYLKTIRKSVLSQHRGPRQRASGGS